MALVGRNHSKVTDIHGLRILQPVALTDPIPVLAKHGLETLAKEHGITVNSHILLHGIPLHHMVALTMQLDGGPHGGKNLNVDDGTDTTVALCTYCSQVWLHVSWYTLV